jgi:predicted RNA-binding protein with PUA-like domain
VAAKKKNKPKTAAKMTSSAAKSAAPKRAAKAARSFSTPVSGGVSAGSWHFPPRREGKPHYWLLKQEPTDFSFDDLWAPRATTRWEGVRNFVARTFLRDHIKKGDQAFFYHSNANPSAVVGIVEVVRDGYPDESAFDPQSDYHDPKSTPANPLWYQVDVKAVQKLERPVSLAEMRANPALASLVLLHISQLSVQPVTEAEWKTIVAMSTGRD